MPTLVALITLLVVSVAAIVIGSRRFAIRQEQRGRWDQYGPLEETEAPRGGVTGRSMSERLEVVGRWKGKVLRRRRPGEQP
jgi:hypothetical protein